MTFKGKKTSSPLQSLLQQWYRHSRGSGRLTSRPYRILLQWTNSSLQLRTQAVAPALNQDDLQQRHNLYIRAGVRVPEEAATRDLMGGHFWLLRLMELLFDLEEDAKIDERTAAGAIHVIWISTETSPSSITGKLLDSKFKSSNLTILNGSRDPWGWDDDSSMLNLTDLDRLARQIQKEVDDRPSDVMVIFLESLSPILMQHGLGATNRFLLRLTADLVVSSVPLESATAMQHAQLEEISHALLWLHEGDLNVVRQGVRESGNMMRDLFPFQLVKGPGGSYRLEEQVDVLQHEHVNVDIRHNDAGPSTITPTLAPGRARADATETMRQSKRNVSLQLEDDMEKLKTRPQPSNQPRIFLQDDDPEFDDLDEEDPDDDLDI